MSIRRKDLKHLSVVASWPVPKIRGWLSSLIIPYSFAHQEKLTYKIRFVKKPLLDGTPHPVCLCLCSTRDAIFSSHPRKCCKPGTT